MRKPSLLMEARAFVLSGKLRKGALRGVAGRAGSRGVPDGP